MSKKALLMILDGWGIGSKSHSNVIYSTPTPYLDSLLANYPNSQLQASGEDVGLPEGIHCWQIILTHNSRLRVKMWDFPKDKWATRKLVT